MLEIYMKILLIFVISLLFLSTGCEDNSQKEYTTQVKQQNPQKEELN